MFDIFDIQELKRIYDQDFISKIDIDNVLKIYSYLINEGVYFAKDILVSYLDICFLSIDEFVIRFNQLKEKLGNDYLKKLEDDISLIELII